MTKIPVLSIEGKKGEDLVVNDSVFGLPWNEDLLHQVYTVIAGNLRATTAHTKNRSERSGSGKKPWKQKGTGRARVGSVRSPLWRKGGIVFGPRNDRNYVRSLNIKMRRKATAVALSGKVRENTCLVLEVPEKISEKTKDMVKMLAMTEMKGTILFGMSTEEREMFRSIENIPKVTGVLVQDLNAYELLNTKNIILTKAAVKVLEERLKRESSKE